MLLQVILALVLIVHACTGTSTILFYQGNNTNSLEYQTEVFDYQTCYQAPTQINVSDIVYFNREFFKTTFTLTVYATPFCGGDYRRWNMYIAPFRTFETGYMGKIMDQNIGSWAVSDLNLPDEQGYTFANISSTPVTYTTRYYLG
ncbi:hypothetical protein BGZ49_004648 [Haplosporangium sp. Z 27]|nr:hypothetical protein BGZ49_004648 [Haplosporangium sp. Z 27]